MSNINNMTTTTTSDIESGAGMSHPILSPDNDDHIRQESYGSTSTLAMDSDLPDDEESLSSSEENRRKRMDLENRIRNHSNLRLLPSPSDVGASAARWWALWLKPIAKFLLSCTATPQLVMWGFLVWYLVVVILTFPKLESTKPFLDACVIMMLVGLVLNVNSFVAYQQGVYACPVYMKKPTLERYLKEQTFCIVRLFLIPYCVSCYSGLANSAPGFVSIFPVEPHVLYPAVFGSISFPLLLRLTSNYLNSFEFLEDDADADISVSERRRENVSRVTF